MIGQNLAHYQVIAKLGEGGMGVVYRATDTRLGRDVAIKVLPAAVASDPERLARFEREARTLASLNHPNIAAIYGVEQGALVMELVEGRTLAELVQLGAIPLDEALPIVRQIADGKTIFLAIPRSGLMAAPASGGESRVLLQRTMETGGIAFAPDFLPAGAGGDWILVGVGTFAEQKIVAANIKTGEQRELGLGNFPIYSQSGHIIFSREGGGADGLWAFPFSLRELRTTGEAFLVAAGGALASVASDGTLVYLESGAFMAQMVVRDRGGKPIGKASAPQPGIRHMAASPDGQRTAVSSTEQGNPDIWIHDLGRSLKSRITFDPAVELYPRWSPDGKQIVFRRNNDLVIQPADGSGGSVLAAGGEQIKSPTDWSADGRYIVYTVTGATAGSNDIWYLKRRPDNGFEPVPFLQTPFQESNGRLSPNGRYVAHLSDETGRFELYVRPFPEGPGKWQVTTNGAVQIRWSHDGKELFYLQGETLMAVDVSTEGPFTMGAPKRLFATGSYQNEWNAAKYDVMPDGRFLILESAEGSGARPPAIHVVENWTAAATQSNK